MKYSGFPERFLHAVAPHSLVLVLALVVGAPFPVRSADTGQTFATPEEAVAALVAAASSHDTQTFHALFGPSADEIQNADPVQAANERDAFNAACRQQQRIVPLSDARCRLEVGENFWPFPVPIVKQNGKWFFDTEAGKQEVHDRRIGKNELSALQTVRAYVEAQREYSTRDRDGDEVLEFAQKFLSTDGSKDGLYWPPELDGELSPLGPLVAQAQDQGYAMKSRKQEAAPEPFNGYFFRILTRQTASAPGGKYDYVVNGNQIGGFALVAWPAEYGASGIMTFIVNQQGRVYQKNLGPETERAVKRTKAYDPDKTWSVSRD